MSTTILQLKQHLNQEILKERVNHTIAGSWSSTVGRPVVVYTGCWLAEPALVAVQPFALQRRCINCRCSGVLLMNLCMTLMAMGNCS